MYQFKKLLKSLTKVALIGILPVLATSCASIVNGQNQPLSVETLPAKGAKCTLENDKGKWFIPQTPGSVTVHRSYADINIVCEKKGFKNMHKKVKSTTKPMAFGNIVFGGVIGAGVDMASGAAYDYPTDIIVQMQKG